MVKAKGTAAARDCVATTLVAVGPSTAKPVQTLRRVTGSVLFAAGHVSGSQMVQMGIGLGLGPSLLKPAGA